MLPIGVLDTGAGGLSVVRAIRECMPHEDIHYFADTAHVPYGIKSPELITHLAVKMAKRLVDLSSCKLLVVACHTISVWCLAEIERAVKIPVIGMVEPSVAGLAKLVAARAPQSIGVLSTKATLDSRVYHKSWPHIDPRGETRLVEHACGPMVSLVEEDVDDNDAENILKHFLPEKIKDADMLLLGCTHFSALITPIKRVVNPSCMIVDAGALAADSASLHLANTSMLSEGTHAGRLTVYVTDNRERFQIIARRFMDDALLIELLRDYARS